MEFNLNGSFRIEKELICSNLLQISINGCFVRRSKCPQKFSNGKAAKLSSFPYLKTSSDR